DEQEPGSEDKEHVNLSSMSSESSFPSPQGRRSLFLSQESLLSPERSLLSPVRGRSAPKP
ncbi:unnamed protein product, partial [Amoebophrya sp. A25]